MEFFKKMYKTKNVRNYDSGKVAKFQDAKISGFGVNLKKHRGGWGPPPRPIGLIPPPGPPDCARSTTGVIYKVTHRICKSCSLLKIKITKFYP